MLQGDWGYSFVSRLPVQQLILQRLPTTLFVLGSAYVLALLIALPVGILSAIKPYSFFDQLATTFAFVGYSMPTFFYRLAVYSRIQHLSGLVAVYLQLDD
jgi:peptide/nickel transport system permease protein